MDQGMNGFLGAYYGNAPQAQAEDTAQQAQIEFFAKTAASHGIDLSKLSEDQINWLWSETFKTAEEEKEEGKEPPPPPAKKDDEKEDEEKKAEAEFLQKKEAMSKIAEADFLGRVIAHAFWNENEKIAAENAKEEEEAKEAGAKETAQTVGKAVKEYAGKGVQKLKDVGKSVAEHTGISDAAEAARSHRKLGPGGVNVHPGTRHIHEEARKSHLIEAGKKGAKTLAAGATVGLAAKGAKDLVTEKKGSALDWAAAECAMAKVAESQYWDIDEAAERLDAVLTLGVEESMKIASAPNYETALDIRALELLELAGYPIEWAQG